MNGNKAGLTDIKWIHTILLPLRVPLALTLPLSVPLIPIPRTAPFSPIGPDVLSKLSPLTTLFHQSRRVAFEAVELAELLPAALPRLVGAGAETGVEGALGPEGLGLGFIPTTGKLRCYVAIKKGVKSHRIMTSPPLLNLASLGRSLDQARRARRSEHGAGDGVQAVVQPRVQPPIAPRGCHLNLCHLCAPLLLHRASAATTSSDSTSSAFPAQRSTLLPHPLAPPPSRPRYASWSDTAESLSPSSDTIDTPPSPMLALEDGWDVPIVDDAQANETGETGETASVDALRLDLGQGQGDDSARAVDRAETGGTTRTLPDSDSALRLGAATPTRPPGFQVSERHGAEVQFQSQTQSQSQSQSQSQFQTTARTDTVAPDPVSVVDANSHADSHADSRRTPWNTLLLRATAGNAKSRRLALGGYVAPPKSLRGGEMDGGDVLPRGLRTSHISRTSHTSHNSRDQDEPRDHNDRAMRKGVDLRPGTFVGDDEEEHAEEARREQEERLGFSSSWAHAPRVQSSGNATNETDEPDATRRVVLSPRPGPSGSEQLGARCLVCRAGVEGWLRVYTG
ncbi:hypothetical protein JCM24511_09119 [Saitozyma sp. JCM 24511]|nr:hypothetical protein JCM24511_09119 [Saitozyma sp. JCM 24511]